MPEEHREADRLAARLRLMMAELMDEPSDVRIAHLDAEVKRALDGKSNAERRAILEALGPMFPRLEQESSAPAAQSASSDPADPESALRILEENASSMSEPERQLAASRLARVGFAMPGGRVGWSAETSERMTKTLGLRPGEEPDPERVAALATMLADAMIKLDRAAWAAWQEIAPRSRIRQRGALKDVLARFSAGEDETPRVTAEGDVEQTRMLAALLIGSMGHAGQAAWDHVRPMQPAEIESASGARGKHRKLWAMFEEMAGERLTAHALEGHMRGFIESFVQEVMLGRTR